MRPMGHSASRPRELLNCVGAIPPLGQAWHTMCPEARGLARPDRRGPGRRRLSARRVRAPRRDLVTDPEWRGSRRPACTATSTSGRHAGSPSRTAVPRAAADGLLRPQPHAVHHRVAHHVPHGRRPRDRRVPAHPRRGPSGHDRARRRGVHGRVRPGGHRPGGLDGPADFGTYLGQQFAWAYSMVQIFLRHTPRLVRRYTPAQALQFLMAQSWYLLWSLSLATLWTLPIVALLSDHPIAHVSLWEFLVYNLGVVVTSSLMWWWTRRWFQPAGIGLTWRGVVLEVAAGRSSYAGKRACPSIRPAAGDSSGRGRRYDECSTRATRPRRSSYPRVRAEQSPCASCGPPGGGVRPEPMSVRRRRPRYRGMSGGRSPVTSRRTGEGRGWHRRGSRSAPHSAQPRRPA